MKRIKFSIITVCLDPGEKLARTLESVRVQTCGDWEIILKDGGSTDGAVERVKDRFAADARLRVSSQPDQGIYDAMNQASRLATGDYVLFLNCGDTLADERVLERAAEKIAGFEQAPPAVFYGDTYGVKNDVLIAAPPVIDGFTCYRNIPCHQSCFYAAELVHGKPYDLRYRIRADYEHFLWCYYRAHAAMRYLGITVSAYEGDGFSESRDNRAADRAEHRRITEQYIPAGELRRYRLMMALTLAPLRRVLAESRVFAGAYHGLKRVLYRKGH